MIPELHNLSRSSLYAAQGGCCTGWAFGISWMWYFAPGSFPIPSNISVNSDNTYSQTVSLSIQDDSIIQHLTCRLVNLTRIRSQGVNTCMDLRHTG